jgi:hypothetical protein
MIPSLSHYPGWFDMPYGLRDPVPNESWPAHLPLPQGSPIYLAPALQYVLQALHLAMKLKPVLVICYIPALRVPTPVWQLAKTWLEQGWAALLFPSRSMAGGWLSVGDLYRFTAGSAWMYILPEITYRLLFVQVS